MKIRKTVLLGLLVLGLGAYILAIEKPRMDAEGKEDRLVEVEAPDVSVIRLEYPDSTTIRLERQDDDWRMREPIDAPADGPVVDRLLEQIVKAKAERRIAGDVAQDLGTYGLEGSGERARITLTRSDGSELPAIIVGKTTPVGFHAFVRIEGNDEVIVTPLIFHTGIKKTPFDLRDKRLFRIDSQHVLTLTIDHGNESIRISREGDEWRLTSPHPALADKDRVQSLLGVFNSLRALAYYDGNEIDRNGFGLDQPSLSVSAELGDKGTIGFRLGAKAEGTPPGYYFERSGDGQVAKVAEWVSVRFQQSASDLRDKHVFNCEPDQIARIRFERADGQSFALVRGDDNDWRIEPPSQRSLKKAAITRTRSSLATLAGKEIVADGVSTPDQLARYGLDAPVVDVEIRLADDSVCGRAIAAITDADSDNPHYFIKKISEGTVMSVPEYLYSRMNMVPDDFLAPEKQKAATNE